jgi:diacylglycerol kinase
VVILILLIALVLTLEILNTIIEHMVDIVQPRLHESVRTIKDMMAGAVLVSSLGSVIIGLIIILPYLVEGTLRF